MNEFSSPTSVEASPLDAQPFNAQQAPRYDYAVLRQSGHDGGQQSGLYVDCHGGVFHFDATDKPLLALRPGSRVSATEWQSIVQSQQALLEQESLQELQRVARANALLSNETLTAPEQQAPHDEQYFFISIDREQHDSEPVIIFQDGDWRRDNAADEARIVKAFLVNKARKYPV